MIKAFMYLISLSLFTAGGFWAGKTFLTPQTAYVDIHEIYNTYPLKAELETELDRSQKLRERQLDSLERVLNAFSLQVKKKPKDSEVLAGFLSRKQELAEMQQQLTEEAEQQAQYLRSQIWKQLREYIDEYGDEKGYQYIFSSDDSYYLLYHDKGSDITEELKAYLAKRYGGK